MFGFLTIIPPFQIPDDKLLDWFITVGSTLAGVFVGGYLTYFLQKKGSLKIYMTNLEWRYSSKEYTLHYIAVDEAHTATLSFNLEVVNTKQISQNIRNINLKLCDKKKSVTVNIKDMSKLINRAGRESAYDNLSIANIPPNSIQQYDLSIYIENENISFVKSSNLKIYLTYN
tara:strand:- start:8333 stop:8848 length:516 start_codon:yes stop_codon:yes gene_type:complete